MQARATPRGLDPARSDNGATSGLIAPPLKIAHMYYSSNGVPIDEDKSYDYNGRFGLQMATESDKFNLKEGYTTAKLHFHRENRCYASLRFDGSIWYGPGKLGEKGYLFFYSRKKRQQAPTIKLAPYYNTSLWSNKLRKTQKK